jgi:prepilin-type N-terminal cleavage/methylation domain-containing protein
MILKTDKTYDKNVSVLSSTAKPGFTIVELLVVIVVIGILAAITLIAYTTIASRANTAAGQSEANAAMMKVNAYTADTPYTVPTTYGSITGASISNSYYAPTLAFTTSSGNEFMTAKPSISKSIDFFLCGTSGSATVPTAYASTSVGSVTGISVPSGVKIGYWDQIANSLNTTLAVGTVSGTYMGNPVACFKVGLAESAIAVAKAMYSETGSYPTTAASFNAGTTNGAKLPNGEIVSITNPTSATSGVNAGNAYVKFECGSAVSGTGPCLNTGGRITYWDYVGSALATETYGTATNFWLPAS